MKMQQQAILAKDEFSWQSEVMAIYYDYLLPILDECIDILSFFSFWVDLQATINQWAPPLSGGMVQKAMALGIMGAAVFFSSIFNAIFGMSGLLWEMKKLLPEIEEEWDAITMQWKTNEAISPSDYFSFLCKSLALLIGALGILFGVAVYVVSVLAIVGVPLGAPAIPLALLCPVVLEAVYTVVVCLLLLPTLLQWYQATEEVLLESEREAVFELSFFALQLLALVSIVLMVSIIAGSALSGGILPAVLCGLSLALAFALTCFQVFDKKHDYQYTTAIRAAIGRTKETISTGFQYLSTAASTAWSSFSFFRQPRNESALTSYVEVTELTY